MVKVNYFSIVKDAAAIAWKNRYMWWFGFFILLSAAGGSFFQYFPRQDQTQKQKFLELLWTNKEWALFIFFICFLIWLALMVLGIVGKGALIKSINSEIENKRSNFKQGFGEGKKYFWKIIIISLLAGAFLLATLIVFIIPIGFLFYNKAIFLGVMLSILAVIIFIPVVFLVGFIRLYGYFYTVLSDLSLGEALENAYALLQKNIVPSILIALTLFALSVIVTVAAVLVAIPIVVVFLVIGALLFLLAKQIGIIITMAMAMTAILGVMFFGGSVYQVFTHAILVIFFKEIAGLPEEPVAVEEEKETAPVSAPDPIIGN